MRYTNSFLTIFAFYKGAREARSSYADADCQLRMLCSEIYAGSEFFLYFFGTTGEC